MDASTLANTLRMDSMIQKNVAAIDKNDPEKKMGLLVDEWGTWYDVEKGTNAGLPVPAEYAARCCRGGA
jgi:alpha-N-arabinofuranosidase